MSTSPKPHPFAALTSNQNDLLSKYFDSLPSDEVIIKMFNISITIRILHCLKEREWINDEIVNFYMALLYEYTCINGEASATCYFYNTHFYEFLQRSSKDQLIYESLKKWTKINIFKYKYLFFPINIRGNHWALVVIDMQYRLIKYYDSLINDASYMKLTIFNQWLHGEFQKHQGSSVFQMFKVVCVKSPQQDNGDDCGVYMLSFALLITLGLEVELMEKKFVPLMRKKIAISIVDGEIHVYAFYNEKENYLKLYAREI